MATIPVIKRDERVQKKGTPTTPVETTTRDTFETLDTTQQQAIQDQVSWMSQEELGARVDTWVPQPTDTIDTTETITETPVDPNQSVTDRMREENWLDNTYWFSQAEVESWELATGATPSQEKKTAESRFSDPNMAGVVSNPDGSTTIHYKDGTTREIPAETTPVEVEETPETPVQTAQDVKNQELVNKADEEALAEQNKLKQTTEFQNMVTSWATKEELASFAIENPEFNKEYNSILRNHFKTQANTSFYSKYAGMSNEAMYSAIKNWKVVQGSEQYNLLPESQKIAFEQYRKELEAPTIKEPTDFTTPENQIPTYQEAGMPVFYGTNSMEQIQAVQNNPQLSQLNREALEIQNQIDRMDRDMINIQERIEKENAGKISNSSITKLIRDESRAYQTEKFDLMLEYRLVQGDIASINSEIDREIDLIKYNDEIAREKYQIDLGIYESRRSEIREDQQLELLERNKILAEERQNAFTLEMKKLDQQFQVDNKSPQYQTDVNWNIVAISGTTATPVMTTDWELVSVTKENGYTDSTKYDSDLWMYVTTRSYDDGSLPDFFTADLQGNSSTNLAVFDSISAVSNKKGKYIDWVGLYQCGEWVNYYLKESGITNIHIGNSYESKKKWVEEWGNQMTPQVWGLAVWNPPQGNGEWSEWGHVGIVTGYDSATNMVEITDWNAQRDGKTAGQKDTYKIPVSQVVNSDGGFVHLDVEWVTQSISQVDIATFNSNTFKPESLDTKEDKEKYATYLEQKNQVMSDKDADIVDIMKFSQWGKELTDSTIGSLTKFDSVINQLWWIQEQISSMETWPITWKLAWLNPYNTDAQVLKAQLTALIPNLARGVYWEVGVLTDNDIKLYSKTIPNLESTEEVNKAVLAMTLKVVAGWYKRQLQSLAAAWKDVSWFQWLYDNLSGQVEALENEIGLQEKGREDSVLLDWWQSTQSWTYDWRQQYEQYENAVNVDYIFDNN